VRHRGVLRITVSGSPLTDPHNHRSQMVSEIRAPSTVSPSGRPAGGTPQAEGQPRQAIQRVL